MSIFWKFSLVTENQNEIVLGRWWSRWFSLMFSNFSFNDFNQLFFCAICLCFWLNLWPSIFYCIFISFSTVFDIKILHKKLFSSSSTFLTLPYMFKLHINRPTDILVIWHLWSHSVGNISSMAHWKFMNQAIHLGAQQLTFIKLFEEFVNSVVR